MNNKIFNLKTYKEKRQSLRVNSTKPEQVLWTQLRGQQLGVKFRRQHGIGHYIVDFYCSEFQLVIEIDGDSHFSPEAIEKDEQRDAYMRGLGLKIIRVTNIDVMNNLEGVYDVIKKAIDKQRSI